MTAPGCAIIAAPFYVVGARYFSTHHESAAARVAGQPRDLTPPSYPLLEGRARRFTSLVLQLHLEVCGPLHARCQPPPQAIFATRHGEIQTAEALIVDLRDNAMVSSARFALSVHNTPSGLYSVASKNAAPTTTITGGNALAAGWLEAALALADGAPVLLSIADEAVPPAMRGPSGSGGYAAAFLLARGEVPPGGVRARLLQRPAREAALDDEAAAVAVARAALAAESASAATIALGALGPATELLLEVAATEAA